MSITILDVNGKAIYTADTATTMKEAAEQAVREGVALSRAYFSRANLSRANLSGAHLSGAHLSRAHLSRANLSRANLSGADLSGAHLSGANLSGANLSGADLSGANLYRANLYRAKGILHVGPVDGWDMYAVRWDDGPRIKAGCRWFTVSEAREWWGKGGTPWNKPEHGPLMLAGLDALLAMAKAHGWEMP